MIQKLNLIPPDPDRELPTREPEHSIQFDPAIKPDAAAVEIVTNLGKQIAGGPKPEWLFLCGTNDTTVSFQAKKEDKPIMLLFMSALAALDYITATKVPAGVKQLKFTEVPQAARKWLAEGQVGGVSLNRCPRCPVILSIPLEACTEIDKLAMVWAMRRAVQIYSGQLTMKQFLAAQDANARITALETIRDHVDCGIPYLYELLCFHARIAENQTLKDASLEQLQRFGPPFADWETRWAYPSEGLARVLAEAMVGLGLSFGIQINVNKK